MVRQLILATAVVVFSLLAGTLGAQPALAHDALLPAQADDGDARNEIATLNQEIRQNLSNTAKLPALRVAAADKAERRRQLVNQLAQTNPKAVLDLAFDAKERNAMPDSVRNLVEAPVSMNGELQVLHLDYEDGHTEYIAKIVKEGKETPLRFGAPIQGAQPGDKVNLTGVALAGDPTVVTDELVTAQSTSAAGPTGVQKTAIILVSAPGAAAHPYANKTNTASIFFSTSNTQSAYTYYSQSSYGQTTIAGGSGTEGSASDVYGPYTLSTATCDTTTLANQAFAAADSELNFNNYNRVVISVNYSSCGNGGVGTVRVQTVGVYDGGVQQLSVAWDYNNALGSTALNGKIGGVALHEYGHNLGVWHANTLECGSVAIGSDACSSTEYGDPADVMGNSSGYGHMNGVHKDILTWLSGSRAQTVTSNGSYTLNAYEDGTNNTKVLKIARTRNNSGTVNGYYYLEYRKPISTWNGFLTGRTDYGNGVLIHTAGATPLCTSYCGPDYSGAGGGGDSQLVDTQPSSLSGTNDFNDAPLLSGESYTDTAAGVTISVTSANPSLAVVSVTFSTPARSVRTIVYPANSGYTVSGGGTFSVGQSVTLTASPALCFIRWRENRSSQSYPNPYTFTMAGDRELEASFATSCGPAPSNDNFPGATITPSQQTATTTGSSTESGEPLSFTCENGTVPIGKTVWYSYTPSANGTLTFSTAGSSYDTVARAYTGSAVGGLTPVSGACDDDYNGTTQSQISFAATAGTTYRLQVGGYDSDAGSLAATLSYQADSTTPTPPTPTPTPPTPTPIAPDPRQEGPVQIAGSLTPNSTATFVVAVKNYGNAATPAIHPYIDGNNNANQSWHADGSQPASAVIQPGQTQSFTLSLSLNSARIWTASTINLWDNDHNTVYRALPANGQNQQFSFTLVMSCAPRPPVEVKASPSGDGRLTVTITAGATDYGNRLHSLRFATDTRTANTNALIDVPGIGSGLHADSVVPLPGNPTSFTFYLRRQTPGQAVTVPVEVTDDCGPWQTIVGGGVAAGF